MPTRDEAATMGTREWIGGGIVFTYLIVLTVWLICSLKCLWGPGPSPEALATPPLGSPVAAGEKDFTLSLSGFPAGVPRGRSYAAIAIESRQGYQGPVALEVETGKGGPVAEIVPSRVDLKAGESQRSILVLDTAPEVEHGCYAVALIGRGAAGTHTLAFSINVGDSISPGRERGERPVAGGSSGGPGLLSAVRARIDRACLGCHEDLSDETRLWLVVLLAGALGAALHALRSAYWYAGNRVLALSWLPMYVLLPWIGGILSIGFYFIVRGGFFAPTTPAAGASIYGFLALAFLIGMFSNQAVIKLQQVAETVFTRPAPGSDARPQQASAGVVPGFEIALERSEIGIAAGGSDTQNVTLRATGGFDSAVTLGAEVSGAAAGAAPSPTAAFASPTLVPAAEGSAAALTISAPAGTPPGSYRVTVNARGGALSRTATVEVTVRA
jgi:hypothetical protein